MDCDLGYNPLAKIAGGGAPVIDLHCPFLRQNIQPIDTDGKVYLFSFFVCCHRDKKHTSDPLCHHWCPKEGQP